MKTTILMLAVALAAGCSKPGKPVNSSRETVEFKVQRLFTVDGITVYRFKDCGSEKYFASSGSTSYRVLKGKTSCLEEIATVQPDAQPDVQPEADEHGLPQ